MKTHWKKAFKSDYLSSSDIDDKDLILTIEKVKKSNDEIVNFIKSLRGKYKNSNVSTKTFQRYKEEEKKIEKRKWGW